MAKRTRFGNKPSARPSAKRAAKPAAPGKPAAAPARAISPAAADRLIAPAQDHDHDHDHDEMPLRSGAALTEAEIARAAELEAAAMAQERAAIAESLRRRAKSQAGDGAVSGDVNAPLAVRMAHEYAYVSRDVRNIAWTAGLMVLILAVLHILVNVLGVITL
jgi:hypothetical protein